MDREMATIVVIDDDLSIREVVSRILKLENHDVLEFEDGQPALEKVDFDQVDLLITDLRMPTSGDQVIAELKEKGVDVPTIVLSGCVDDTQAQHLEMLGVKEIMEKPFRIAELLGRVRNCIHKN